jgi:hypothetical protein
MVVGAHRGLISHVQASERTGLISKRSVQGRRGKAMIKTVADSILIVAVPCLILWAFVEGFIGIAQSAGRTASVGKGGRIIATTSTLIDDLKFVLRAIPFILVASGLLLYLESKL